MNTTYVCYLVLIGRHERKVDCDIYKRSLNHACATCQYSASGKEIANMIRQRELNK